MFDFWQNELTEEETNELLEKANKEIRAKKLEAPAILFFEMHKPLSNVFAHASLAFAPYLVPLLGYDFVNRYSLLLKKRDNVERLIEMLEIKEVIVQVVEPESVEESCP